MQGKSIEQLNVGDFAVFSKTLSESDVYLYAGITGDFNPAHINEIYARQTFFRKRIAHGMISGGLISAAIGTRLPGTGSIYISQSLEFKAPVYIGDTITARVEITEIDKTKNRVFMKTDCYNQDDTLIMGGSAVVSPPKSVGP